VPSFRSPGRQHLAPVQLLHHLLAGLCSGSADDLDNPEVALGLLHRLCLVPLRKLPAGGTDLNSTPFGGSERLLRAYLDLSGFFLRESRLDVEHKSVLRRLVCGEKRHARI
jgi:hypothetical protein